MSEPTTPAPRWSSAADVRARWLSGPLAVEDERIEVLLEDVEDYLVSEFPDLAERLEDGRLRASRVRRIVVVVAIRVLRNPEGYRQVATGTGPFTASATFGGATPGEVFLTPTERVALGGTKRSRRRAGSTYIN